jgi:dolichyl-phosphate-mannose-protein mannosyltransferase
VQRDHVKKSKRKEPALPQSRTSSRTFEWLVLALVILAAGALRFRLLEIPFERDEGEYAYMGQQILKGIPLYSQAYDIKFPGIYMMYALLMSIFGQNRLGIHLGLMVVNFSTIVLVYLLGKKIADGFTGLIAAAAYAVLSISSSTLGFAAHATHFVVLPVIGGILLLLRAMRRPGRFMGYLLSGFVSGIGLIMKQPTVFLILFSVSYLIVSHYKATPRPARNDLLLKGAGIVLGSALPLLGVLFWLYAIGTFGKFWFWGVKYAFTFGTQMPLSSALAVFGSNLFSVVDGFILLWIMGGVGLLIFSSLRQLKVRTSFLPLFALFSFLSMVPGFHFREHYFVLFLPALSLLTGTVVSFLRSTTFKRMRPSLATAAAVGLFIAGVVIGLVSQRGYFFKEDLTTILRDKYGENPFPECVPVAEFIATNSDPADKIAVLGSEPQIYFYAGRQSATAYIDTYNLMAHHPYALEMQKDMIRGIETSKPKFIVYANANYSWLRTRDSEDYIFDWLNGYLKEYYSQVGVADILQGGTTEYTWEEQAANYKPKGASFLAVLRRK